MRHWLAALVLCFGAAPALAVELFEAPSHLRFSAREVSAAARRQQAVAEPAVSVCDLRCQRIEHVWQRLLPLAQEQPRSESADLRLIVVESGSSAYAHADGSVVFPLSLADELALSDAEIAFILAHELIHVLLEHEREALTTADAFLRPDVRRSAADVYATLLFELGLGLKTSFLMQAAELEADAFGLQLAALAGFDPAAQVVALDKRCRRARAGAPCSPRTRATMTASSASARCCRRRRRCIARTHRWRRARPTELAKERE